MPEIGVDFTKTGKILMHRMPMDKLRREDINKGSCPICFANVGTMKPAESRKKL